MTNHIKDIHDDNKSWCGQTLNNEFYFKSIDQAVLNGMQNEISLHTCCECIDLIIRMLDRGSKKFIIDGEGNDTIMQSEV